MSDIIELLSKDPTSILSLPSSSSKVLSLVKEYFDPITKQHSVLDEVYVDGLDASQVWAQSKMIIDSVVEDLMFEKIPALKTLENGQANSDLEEELSQSEDNKSEESDNDASQIDEEDENSENDFEDAQGNLIDDYEGSEVEEEDDEEEEDEENEEEDDDEEEDQKAEDGENNESEDKSGLDDKFFSIDEFNKQTLEQDRDDYQDNDDEEIDFFGDIPSEDDEEVAYFDDFFDKPKDKRSFKPRQLKNKPKKEKVQSESEEEDFNEEDFDDGMKSVMLDMFDDEEPAPVQENLSSFEKQQLQIQKEIAQLEKESIAEKKWTLKGESKAKDRPTDSLLSEDLAFERTAKPVPVITQEVTESLEEMIRRRIKEGNFDDLPRRVITDVTNFRPSSSFELSETKSSKSLAELYEDDYKGETKDEVSEELQKAHDEVKSLFDSISYKLDALSSAHFIPKPAQKQLDIKVNAPAISMEDAQPLTLSSASSLAPQEIYKVSRSSNADEISLKSGAVLSREELSREDKHRLRRANKRKRAREFKDKEAKGIKKSKKRDVIDTLSKASNVTIINSKGEKRDVSGALKKDGPKKDSNSLKL